ncbi:MAG: hypothetical protein Q8S48_14740, partial [Methylococcaceae bacterium]|nr:hypothetical protein [Methylococcaceae bacterium]
KTLQTFKAPGKKAFVVDDTIAGRFGKKMPGISSHFDHTSGRHLMGQPAGTGLKLRRRLCAAGQ